MGTLLVRNARVLVTMDDARREIARGEMLIRDGFIEAVGEPNSLPQEADEIVDLTGHIVLPGPNQYPSSSLSVARSCLACIAGQEPDRMAPGPLSALGEIDARHHRTRGRARASRDHPLGMHHRCGSSVSLAPWPGSIDLVRHRREVRNPLSSGSGRPKSRSSAGRIRS